MKYSNFGNTSMKVSELGFGGIPIMSGKVSDFLVDLKDVSYDESLNTLKTAYEKGINFFDTALDYGDSEEKMGKALKDVRNEIVIASKSKALTYEKMLKDVHKSLATLKTDYIDLYQLHYVKDTKSYQTIMDEENGAYKALLECQKAGKIREIGIASHNIYVLEPAINANKFSTVQLPVNLIEQECVDLIKLANSKNMGIIAMKPFAGGTLTKPLPSLAKMGLTEHNIRKLALSYIFSTKVTTAIPGMSSLDELNENLEIYNNLDKLTNDELDKIEVIRSKIGKVFCRRCQYCEPCPKGIEIAKILRIVKYYEDYNLTDWAKTQYQELPVTTDACVKCHICESKCPYNLEIVDELERIHNLLKRVG